MKIDILTLFPEMFAPLKESIIKRAVEDGKIEINITNIRDYANPPHYRCDDMPFGGGAGMVMMCEPLFKAIEAVKQENSKIFYMSPRGKVFNQSLAREMSNFEHIVLLCGHYEGIDQRVIDYFNIEELSIGDYVLTGGEIPAMVVNVLEYFLAQLGHVGSIGLHSEVLFQILGRDSNLDLLIACSKIHHTVNVENGLSINGHLHIVAVNLQVHDDLIGHRLLGAIFGCGNGSDFCLVARHLCKSFFCILVERLRSVLEARSQGKHATYCQQEN